MKKILPKIIAVSVLIIFIIVAALLFGCEPASGSEATEARKKGSAEIITESPAPAHIETQADSLTAGKNNEIKSTHNAEPFVFDESNPDYREAMRQWVIRIGKIARKIDNEFLIIPQNGVPLLTDTGHSNGHIVYRYVSAIDAIGVEGISFGSNEFNSPRNKREKQELIDLLDIGVRNGINILAVDYCGDEDKAVQAIALNDGHGFLSFIAVDMELRDIPKERLNINDKDILQLNEAENWLYLLNPEKYSSKKSFLKALSETNYDVLVIDAFFDTEQMLTNEDVMMLKTKKNGAERIVIAYMSIGEAEDYRYYWKDEYDDNPPSWMLRENPLWQGNYPVKYWDENWQEIIATGEHSYLKHILDSGFDGVYLDIVDGYEAFEDIE